MSQEVAIISGWVICGIGAGYLLAGIVRDLRSYLHDRAGRKWMRRFCQGCGKSYPNCNILRYQVGPKAQCPNCVSDIVNRRQP